MTNEVTNAAIKAVSSDAVQNKLVSMLDALQQGAFTVGNAVIKYSPDVANTMLDVIRINGIQTLIYNTLLLTGSLGLFYYIKKSWSKSWFDEYAGPTAAGVLGCIFIIISNAMFINSTGLFNIWNWIEVFQPKLWIAHEVIRSALPSCNC